MEDMKAMFAQMSGSNGRLRAEDVKKLAAQFGANVSSNEVEALFPQAKEKPASVPPPIPSDDDEPPSRRAQPASAKPSAAKSSVNLSISKLADALEEFYTQKNLPELMDNSLSVAKRYLDDQELLWRKLERKHGPRGSTPAAAPPAAPVQEVQEAADAPPRCYVCNCVVPSDPEDDRYYLYKVSPFWGDKYCHKHAGQEGCASCDRLPSVYDESPPVPIGDDLSLCCSCTVTADIDKQQLRRELNQFMEGVLGLQGSECLEVPLKFTSLSKLNSRAGGCHAPSRTRRGLCVTEWRGKRVVGVSGVLVLDGLPWEVAGSVSAHELTHAHIRLTHPHVQLPIQVEEGLCQLASALWLARPGAEKSKLTEHTMWRIENHTDPTYGAGYKAAKGRLNYFDDFSELIDSTCRKGKF